jgi:hypothetical protein
MFDFTKDHLNKKRYGKVPRGWHEACVHESRIKNGKYGRYVIVEFELTDDKYKNILVPGYFSIYDDGHIDPRFMRMGSAIGLTGEIDSLGHVLVKIRGKRLLIKVVHRFREGKRNERAEDFDKLPPF